MAASLFVFSNPVAGREDEYHAWYDGTHIPELLALPGFVAAQRFSSTGDGALPFPACPQGHLAVYELEGDGQDALAAMFKATSSGALDLSDALDNSSLTLWLFAPRGERVTASATT